MDLAPEPQSHPVLSTMFSFSFLAERRDSWIKKMLCFSATFLCQKVQVISVVVAAAVKNVSTAVLWGQ